MERILKKNNVYSCLTESLCCTAEVPTTYFGANNLLVSFLYTLCYLISFRLIKLMIFFLRRLIAFCSICNTFHFSVLCNSLLESEPHSLKTEYPFWINVEVYKGSFVSLESLLSKLTGLLTLGCNCIPKASPWIYDGLYLKDIIFLMKFYMVFKYI